MKLRLVKFALRAMVSVVFISAGYGKILQPDTFSAAIRNYHLVHNGMANILALGIPMTELGAGICLFFGIKPRVMGWVIGLLLIMFIGAISHALWKGEPIGCGCFSGEDDTSLAAMWISFFRDWALLLATFLIIAIHADSNQKTPKECK